MERVTNLQRATEIVEVSKSKEEAIDKIVAELKVTRSNAFVYFAKAANILGDDKTPKSEKKQKSDEKSTPAPKKKPAAKKSTSGQAKIEKQVARHVDSILALGKQGFDIAVESKLGKRIIKAVQHDLQGSTTGNHPMKKQKEPA